MIWQIIKVIKKNDEKWKKKDSCVVIKEKRKKENKQVARER